MKRCAVLSLGQWEAYRDKQNKTHTRPAHTHALGALQQADVVDNERYKFQRSICDIFHKYVKTCLLFLSPPLKSVIADQNLSPCTQERLLLDSLLISPVLCVCVRVTLVNNQNKRALASVKVLRWLY